MYTYMYVHLVCDICVNIESMIGKMITPEGRGLTTPCRHPGRPPRNNGVAGAGFDGEQQQSRNSTKIPQMLNSPDIATFPLFLPENEQIWIDPTYFDTKLGFFKGAV